MTDTDLEWAVELVGNVLIKNDESWVGVVGMAKKIVAALAEPLRQSQRVEELERLAKAAMHPLGCHCHICLDKETAPRLAVENVKLAAQLIMADRRIEELEAVVAAARNLVMARYDIGADYSAAAVRLRKTIESLDTEAKP